MHEVPLDGDLPKCLQIEIGAHKEADRIVDQLKPLRLFAISVKSITSSNLFNHPKSLPLKKP